jgi:hypothetical protein
VLQHHRHDFRQFPQVGLFGYYLDVHLHLLRQCFLPRKSPSHSLIASIADVLVAAAITQIRAPARPLGDVGRDFRHAITCSEVQTGAVLVRHGCFAGVVDGLAQSGVEGV